MNNTHSEKSSAPGYGLYILVWAGLVGLTMVTVAFAGFNLASLTVVVALAIALVQSFLIINYFIKSSTNT
ncbi:MAG: hypothetical protein NTV87_02445 [Ignavibacteriae bacterium]|jgi:caa(3)-type oxidase subunit IV|nr:hypothetical protein [Ignavibacteriota bacterium]